jgi:hypothetical protein
MNEKNSGPIPPPCMVAADNWHIANRPDGKKATPPGRKTQLTLGEMEVMKLVNAPLADCPSNGPGEKWYVPECQPVTTADVDKQTDSNLLDALQYAVEAAKQIPIVNSPVRGFSYDPVDVFPGRAMTSEEYGDAVRLERRELRKNTTETPDWEADALQYAVEATRTWRADPTISQEEYDQERDGDPYAWFAGLIADRPTPYEYVKPTAPTGRITFSHVKELGRGKYEAKNWKTIDSEPEQQAAVGRVISYKPILADRTPEQQATAEQVVRELRPGVPPAFAANKWTPLAVSVLFEIFHQSNLEPAEGSPYREEAVTYLEEQGLITPLPNGLKYPCGWAITDKGCVLVDMFCRTPLPVVSFSDPREKS